MPSSVVSSFHYDKKTQVLTVVFVSGNVYLYKNVPAALYEEMRNAFSKGVFFNERIKGIYPFEKK